MVNFQIWLIIEQHEMEANVTKHLIHLEKYEKSKLNKIVNNYHNGEPNNEREALEKAVNTYLDRASMGGGSITIYI